MHPDANAAAAAASTPPYFPVVFTFAARRGLHASYRFGAAEKRA
jgi:hypothetical protein